MQLPELIYVKAISHASPWLEVGIPLIIMQCIYCRLIVVDKFTLHKAWRNP